MDILFGLILLAAALLVLAFPLYRTRGRALLPSGSAAGELLAQRDGLYATLRDLDLDYELGKMDAGDYRDRREKYLARASIVLQQLDSSRAAQGSGSLSSEEIERGVAALRQLSAQRPAKPVLACPNCGRVYNEGDSFCARCGHTLS